MFPIHDVTTKENTKHRISASQRSIQSGPHYFQGTKERFIRQVRTFFKHARLLFSLVGRGNNALIPYPLERARVRVLYGRTLVSARISSSGWNAFFTSGYSPAGRTKQKEGQEHGLLPLPNHSLFHAMWTHVWKRSTSTGFRNPDPARYRSEEGRILNGIGAADGVNPAEAIQHESILPIDFAVAVRIGAVRF